MPVQAITAITFTTLITIIIPGEVMEGTVEWDSMEDMEEVETGAEVIVEEAEEAGVIPEGAEEVETEGEVEVETEAEDDTFQESRNLKNK